MKLFRKLLSLSLVLIVALTAVPAFATTPTPLTVVVLKQNNYAVVAGDLTITMTALDASNGNSFTSTGREILIVQNTDSSAHTFTVTSVADNLGRSDTSLTSYSVGASGFIAIEMNTQKGWIQGTPAVIDMTTSSALLKAVVLQFN